MGMSQLLKQYQEQLNIVKQQIREMEQSGADAIEYHKYRQLKQMRNELRANICQIKKYTKKG